MNIPHIARFSLLTLALVAALTFSGCAASNAVAVHPGSANAFDSKMYDDLATAKASLVESQVQYTALVPAQQRVIGPILNDAIDAYNIADLARSVYHNSALAGGTPDQAALQSAVVNAAAKIAALAVQIKGAIK